MFFLVKNCLVQMCNAPSLRDMIVKKRRELLTRLLCYRIPPCPERHQKLPVFVKCHVAVHHGAETDGAECPDFRSVLLFYLCRQVLVAILQATPDCIKAVGPDIVHQLVFPVMVANGKHPMVFVNQYRLDSGRAKLNAKCRPAAFNSVFPVKSHLLYLLIQHLQVYS